MANPDLPAPIDYPDKVNVRQTTNHTTEFWAQDANLIKSVVNQIIEAINLLAPEDLVRIALVGNELQFENTIYASAIRTDSGTVQIGPQLSLKDGAGNLLVTKNFDDNLTIPLTLEVDDTGTVRKAFTSEFNAIEPSVVFQSDDTGTMSQAQYVITHPATTNAFVTNFQFKIGTTAPESVNLKLYRSAQTEDELLFEQDFEGPFAPSSDMTLTFDVPAGFYQGDNSIIVLTAPASFNLLSNVGGTEPYWAVERQTAMFYDLLNVGNVETGTGLSSSYENGVFTISLGAASGPMASNFSIDIASRVDVNESPDTVNASHQVSFDVVGASQITSAKLFIGSNEFILTTPTNGSNTQTVTISSVDLTSETTYNMFVEFNGDQSTRSNIRTLRVADLPQQEAVYYGVSASNNSDTIDVANLTLVEVASNTAIPANFSLDNNHWAIILVPNNYTVTSIIENTFSQEILTDFVKTDDVRTIGTITYDSLVHQNLSGTTGVLSTTIHIQV